MTVEAAKGVVPTVPQKQLWNRSELFLSIIVFCSIIYKSNRRRRRGQIRYKFRRPTIPGTLNNIFHVIAFPFLGVSSPHFLPFSLQNTV